jgi:hypothetical protein
MPDYYFHLAGIVAEKHLARSILSKAAHTLLLLQLIVNLLFRLTNPTIPIKDRTIPIAVLYS